MIIALIIMVVCFLFAMAFIGKYTSNKPIEPTNEAESVSHLLSPYRKPSEMTIDDNHPLMIIPKKISKVETVSELKARAEKKYGKPDEVKSQIIAGLWEKNIAPKIEKAISLGQEEIIVNASGLGYKKTISYRYLAPIKKLALSLGYAVHEYQLMKMKINWEENPSDDYETLNNNENEYSTLE